jgi:hypothetical protein
MGTSKPTCSSCKLFTYGHVEETQDIVVEYLCLQEKWISENEMTMNNFTVYVKWKNNCSHCCLKYGSTILRTSNQNMLAIRLLTPSKICIPFERFVLHVAGLYFSYYFLEFGKKNSIDEI